MLFHFLFLTIGLFSSLVTDPMVDHNGAQSCQGHNAGAVSYRSEISPLFATQ